MTQTQLYQPKGRWRVGIAFTAAVLIHFAAIAIANVHRSPQIDIAGPEITIPDVTFEDPSVPISDPDPDVPEALPTPPPTDESFPPETSTPPPVRRQTSKPVAPLVKTRGSGSTVSMTFSSARVFAINAPRPEYPYEARRQRITGDGVVAMTVDPVSGQVSDVSIVKSTGSPFLDNAALAGFRRWRFKPGTVSSVRCPITFTLVGATY
jgi:TonB family protein